MMDVDLILTLTERGGVVLIVCQRGKGPLDDHTLRCGLDVFWQEPDDGAIGTLEPDGSTRHCADDFAFDKLAHPYCGFLYHQDTPAGERHFEQLYAVGIHSVSVPGDFAFRQNNSAVL